MANLPTIPSDPSSTQQRRQRDTQVNQALRGLQDFDAAPVIPPVAADPVDTPASGTVRFNTVNKKLWIFDGLAWRFVVLT